MALIRIFRAMNFLAHIYLSGDIKAVRVGNFMADSIRGKKYLEYDPELQKGILLHRFIDTYTDAHPTFRQSTKRLHKNYSHYSGVIVDIYYDHFLAKNWNEYSPIPLLNYTEGFYETLHEFYPVLPLPVKKLMPYLIADNWLFNYANLDGISRVLNGMNRRTGNRVGMNEAIEDLKLHYTEFEGEFRDFFSELEHACQQKLTELNKTIE